jgi:hypothetical protein
MRNNSSCQKKPLGVGHPDSLELADDVFSTLWKEERNRRLNRFFLLLEKNLFHFNERIGNSVADGKKKKRTLRKGGSSRPRAEPSNHKLVADN